MSDALSAALNIIGQCYNIVTPWGVTFGTVVVGLFGFPILVRMFRKLMG